MYRTCLFCSTALGGNESFEQFAVGRRLAFDGAKGRLWVICPQCARWNLSPLEIRWEAIEAMERAYRDTTLRASTGQIGLAKLRDGTELVRIGQPMLPEFASWRYGQLFRTRFVREQRWLWGAQAVVLASNVLYLGGVQLPYLFGALSIGGAAQLVAFGRAMGRRHRPRVPLRLDDGRRVRLSMYNACLSRLRRDDAGAWYLRLHHAEQVQTGRVLRTVGITHRRGAESTYTNMHGTRVFTEAGRLLPLVNVGGTNAKGVDDAVSCVVNLRTPGALLDQASRSGFARNGQPTILSEMDPSLRLALEMVLHEDDERRALDGELAALEARWREAEEVAQIADTLLLPEDIDMRLAEMQRHSPAD